MSIEDSLVVILKAGSDTPAGGGVAIGNGLVVTCAHVANLGFADRGKEATGRPAGELELRFHRLPNTKFTAKVDAGVDAWSDPPATRERGADLCLLQLTSPPQEMPAAELSVAENCEQKQFHAAGFPQDWHGDLDFADGKVMGRDEHGLLILRSESSATAKSRVLKQSERPAGVIYSGFSGSPVEVEGKIIGLIAEAREQVQEITAYMIPVDVFPKRVPRHQPWTDIQRLSQEQFDRFLPKEQILGQAAYIHRTEEERLNKLVTESSPGMMIIGESGVGKTSMLLRWSRDMLEKGHAVLFYRCGSLSTPEMEREICRDLKLPAEPDLVSTLGHVKRPPGLENSRLILIFDEINDFRGQGSAEPIDLLKRLDSMVRLLADTGVRLAMSCSSAAWKRFDRLGTLKNLTWNCYQGSEPLVVPPFTEEEAQKAYDGYQNILRAKNTWASLPPRVRENLRRPVLLQLLAQSYRDQHVPNDANTLQIYLQYCKERITRLQEQIFIDDLAAEMLRARKRSLATDDKNLPASLFSRFQEEAADAVYESLKEKYILVETEADPMSFDPERISARVQFAYGQIGSYLLARSLAKKDAQTVVKELQDLVSHAGSFSLGWDVAKVFLRLRQDYSMLKGLAAAADAEQRELAVETLVELHDDDPKTSSLLRDLMKSGSIEQQRTALKAAFYIGPSARDLFLWACSEGSPELRQATSDILYLAWRKGSLSAQEGTLAVAYLLWRMDPPFTYKLLTDLVDHISLRNLAVLVFIMRLSITIYINHCEREEVIEQTVALYKALALKLHLKLLRTDMFGKFAERFLFRVLAAAFAGPILKAILLSEDEALDPFFQRPKTERACLHRAAEYLNPASELSQAENDLVEMLSSDVSAFNWAAAVVTGTHAYAHFQTVKPVLRELFDKCNVHGRGCLLLAFAVLLPDTPREWIPLLESFTGTLCKQDEQSMGRLPLSGHIKMLPVPLGLAYAKAGEPMPFFLQLLREASTSGNQPALASCLSGLGAVGFYYPHAIFPVFQEFLKFENEHCWELLLDPLSMMRAIHTDDVDRFLAAAGQDSAYQHRVAAKSNMDVLNRYITIMGLYNNAVHFSAKYPRMRRPFSVGAFHLLAECGTANDFLARYSQDALALFRAAKFNLREWTLPE